MVKVETLLKAFLEDLTALQILSSTAKVLGILGVSASRLN